MHVKSSGPSLRVVSVCSCFSSGNDLELFEGWILACAQCGKICCSMDSVLLAMWPL